MVCKLLHQSVIPPEKMKTHAWVHFWNAISTAFAKTDNMKSVGDAGCIADGTSMCSPVSVATVQAATNSTIVVAKPNRLLPIPHCDQSWLILLAEPGNTPLYMSVLGKE